MLHSAHLLFFSESAYFVFVSNSANFYPICCIPKKPFIILWVQFNWDSTHYVFSVDESAIILDYFF